MSTKHSDSLRFNNDSVYAFDEPDLVSALNEEKIFLVPTDTVYGLCGLFSGKVLEKIRDIKHREPAKALPVAVSDIEMAGRIVKIDDRAKKVIQAFLPGPLTIVLPKKESIDSLLVNGKESIALRIPDQPALLKLIETLDSPIYLTSANLSGEPEAKTFQQARELNLAVDGLIQGETLLQKASTIVDLSREKAQILRPGPISQEEIWQVLDE